MAALSEEDKKVFPAQAGVILFSHHRCKRCLGFPRASGGDPSYGLRRWIERKFSPRKRG